MVGAPHSPSKTGVNALVVGARFAPALFAPTVTAKEGGHKGRPYEIKIQNSATAASSRSMSSGRDSRWSPSLTRVSTTSS